MKQKSRVYMQLIATILSRAIYFRTLAIVLMILLPGLNIVPVYADDNSQSGDGAQIMQAFNQQHKDDIRDKAISPKEKQQIMFLLGVALITLVFITGGLGIAMGLYGKPLFVAHMIFAGLSITLAIVHAIVGLVWFYPF